MSFFHLFILMFGFPAICNGYNILIALPVASKSVHNLCSSLASALLEKGHHVTLFTAFDKNYFHKNYTHFQPYDSSRHLAGLSSIFFDQISIVDLYSYMLEIQLNAIDEIWASPDVKELYNRRNDFDAIVTISYANEPILPFLDGFRGSFVTFCTPGVEYFSVSYQGHWLPPSIVPNLLFPYDEYMSFGERLLNFISLIVCACLNEYIQGRTTTKIREHHPQFTNPREYYERSSLMLINGHFALDAPVPLLPNQIEVGTINAKRPEPLPQDLEEFAQGSDKNGIIYFSFGSFAKAKDITREKKEIFLEAFRQVPQRVIWKYEDNDLDLPPNVITREWLPQQDVLGHPKTRIFMSHCGNLGTQEAKYHGVPVLAIPLAFDQPRNAERLVRKGHAITVDWGSITSEKIVNAINELIHNPIYQERLSNVSRILQDQKESPGERAVWWIEYVIRHGGAPQLVYPGKRLSFFQYIMLDVIAFCVCVLAIFVFLTVFICRRVGKLCRGSSKAKKD